MIRNSQFWIGVVVGVAVGAAVGYLQGKREYSRGTFEWAAMTADPADVDSIMRRLPWTILAYNAPAKMYVGEGQQVALMLAPKWSSDSARQEIAEITGDSAQRVESDTMRFSSRVVARLEGDGFSIRPPPEQARPVAVGRMEPTMWAWEITPIRSGDLLLALSISPLLIVDGKETEKPKRVLLRPIPVRERVLSLVRKGVDKHFEVLAAAAVAIFVGGYYFIRNWRRSRRMGFQ